MNPGCFSSIKLLEKKKKKKITGFPLAKNIHFIVLKNLSQNIVKYQQTFI